MRTVAFLFVVSAIAGSAQTPPAPKLFAGAGDVTSMIAKAKAERKPDQANFIQPIVRLAPYNANLEYRVGSVEAPASVHETEAEMFYVIEGTGTMVTGGKLVDEKRTNAANLSGTKIEGGESRKLAKGDFLIVPAGTPHWITGIDGALALMTLHLPVK
jgi:mannose-6-phosphate isomerase-like protein (cupin superfamily)